MESKGTYHASNGKSLLFVLNTDLKGKTKKRKMKLSLASSTLKKKRKPTAELMFAETSYDLQRGSAVHGLQANPACRLLS